jgi:hypothetical protein
MIEEPIWAGSKTQLTDTSGYGEYMFTIKDLNTKKLIYSRGFSSLFAEWQTTEEAKTTQKSFSESVIFPFPKSKVILEIFCRKFSGSWELKFTYLINPADHFISRERKMQYPCKVVQQSGEPSEKLDIVFISDGYTEGEMKKFSNDCKRFADYLLHCHPYDTYSNGINIWAVEAPSTESGTDIPATGTWKNTVANSTFYTFDSERYLTTFDNKTLRNLAANAPYDQIVLLVNSEKYGGGGIFNQFAVTSVDNSLSAFVFTHEFGHAFAGLGDEYYTSDVAYTGFYNLKVEPWEPNLTTLVNFDAKWKNKVETGIPVPTPNEEKYKNVTGVFEGGGYITKGMYRPAYDCSMKSAVYNTFCPVCRDAIGRMIDFYSK